MIVDYAHNYLSFQSLSELARQLRPDGRLLFVTGSAGGKAQSRRADMGRALGEYADKVYLTSDDPDFEEADAIAKKSQLRSPILKLPSFMRWIGLKPSNRRLLKQTVRIS